MKAKFLFIILFLINGCLFSQILPNYPAGQSFYEGGGKKFSEDLAIQAAKDSIKPCEKKEALFMRFVVYPDATVRYVKSADSIAVENNKCLKDKTLVVLSKLKGWKPAEVDGEKKHAIFQLLMREGLLFGEQNEENKVTAPTFMYKGKESTIQEFRKQFINCFQNDNFKSNVDYRFIVNFEVDTQGQIGIYHIENRSELESFNKMVIKCTKGDKRTSWKPGTFNGIPVTSFFKFPIVFKGSY